MSAAHGHCGLIYFRGASPLNTLLLDPPVRVLLQLLGQFLLGAKRNDRRREAEDETATGGTPSKSRARLLVNPDAANRDPWLGPMYPATNTSEWPRLPPE